MAVIRQHPIRVSFWVLPNDSEVAVLHPEGCFVLTRGYLPQSMMENSSVHEHCQYLVFRLNRVLQRHNSLNRHTSTLSDGTLKTGQYIFWLRHFHISRISINVLSLNSKTWGDWGPEPKEVALAWLALDMSIANVTTTSGMPHNNTTGRKAQPLSFVVQTLYNIPAHAPFCRQSAHQASNQSLNGIKFHNRHQSFFLVLWRPIWLPQLSRTFPRVVPSRIQNEGSKPTTAYRTHPARNPPKLPSVMG